MCILILLATSGYTAEKPKKGWRLQLSPPIVAPPESVDVGEVLRLLEERRLLWRYNAGLMPNSLFDPALRTGNREPFNAWFHISSESALEKIFRGPFPGLRGAEGGNSGDVHRTFRFPVGNRMGPVFGFAVGDPKKMQGADGKGVYEGVPLSNLRFLADYPIHQVGMSVVWIHPDHLDWFKKEIEPVLSDFDTKIKERRAKGLLPAGYLSPFEAMETTAPKRFIESSLISRAQGLCRRIWNAI